MPARPPLISPAEFGMRDYDVVVVSGGIVLKIEKVRAKNSIRALVTALNTIQRDWPDEMLLAVEELRCAKSSVSVVPADRVAADDGQDL